MIKRSSMLLAGLILLGQTCPATRAFEDDESHERYELMKLFVETFEQIDNNYVQDVDRRQLVEAAIEGMVQHLDQYSSYIAPTDLQRFDQVMEQEFGGIGINVSQRGDRLTVISPLPGTPAYRAGIQAGDVIVEVEGQSTEDFTLTDLVKKLQGPAGRPVTLKVVHSGENSQPEEIRVVREIIQVPTVLGDRYNDKNQWEFLYSEDPKIGYIRLTHFSRHTPQELRSTIEDLLARGMEGLVLDLRSNPGGLLEAAIEISDMFLDEGQIVSVKGRNVPERSWQAKPGDTFPDFPLAILVNRFSASASEVLSACLQDNHRAVVIGERTWGKGSVQNVIKVEEGDSALKLTTAAYHRPNGVNIHRSKGAGEDEEWGVKPDKDFLIPFSDKQFTEYSIDRRQRDILRNDATSEQEGATFEDTQLAAALKYLRERIGSPKESGAQISDSESGSEEK
ncbi:MAG: S41 family peptidase [Planctomycetaceae bacterium]